jgi:hypothetical protein
MKDITRTCGALGRNGQPCRRYVGPGFNRCNLHGGATPGAKQKAEQTLALAALPAAEVFFDVIDRFHRQVCPTCGLPNGDPKDAMRAAEVVLNRTGFGPSATVQLTSTDDVGAVGAMTLAQLADRAEAVARRLRAAADAETALLTEAEDGVIVEDIVPHLETALARPLGDVSGPPEGGA